MTPQAPVTKSRRKFLRVAGLAGTALIYGVLAGPRGSAQTVTPATQFIETPTLTIAYEDVGDRQGFPAVLLHGFPDDVRAWDEVVTPLAQTGYRVLTPYLRGSGPTRFRAANAPRMAEQAAIGQDLIDFA